MKLERTRAYTHHQRIINKKMSIAKYILDYTPKKPGIFAKGKVHCSCGMCATKWIKDGPPASAQRWLYKFDTYKE
ncbi:hypothetical protein [Bacillus gaemokensis]|uniref:Uncharacterized protein n=1 Tax=Bacillus gaemokensis TaxID=574375 RepID=A0A073KID9_9BACI|nr:hypothetical protein [Bacillus gaemokensis]KEK26271.1 hypothetical protein BAGA_03255 [Bacillus gaemokensis]KYG39078.1 hypothetical protein AZF08_03310 [Bacillus gaemokensis]